MCIHNRYFSEQNLKKKKKKKIAQHKRTNRPVRTFYWIGGEISRALGYKIVSHH